MKTGVLSLILGLLPTIAVVAQEADAPPEAGTEVTQATAGPPASTAIDWARELRESRLGGLAMELPGDPAVLALFEEERGGDSQGAIVLVHDNGRHPAWPAVIEPLRGGLPDHGWATLSLQAPVAGSGGGEPEPTELIAALDDARPRIQAAVDFLNGKGYRNVVLVGHGMGAVMVADFAAAAQGEETVGVVLIGMRSFSVTDDPRLDTPGLLEKLRVSVLDLYGSNDHADVVRAARSRVSAAQAGVVSTSHYTRAGVTHADLKEGDIIFRQIRFEGADHDFTGLAPELAKTVRGWLKSHAAGMRVGGNSTKQK